MRVKIDHKIERQALRVNQMQRDYHMAQSKNNVAILVVVTVGVLCLAAYVLVGSLGSF